MEEASTDSKTPNKFLPTGKSVDASDCDEDNTKEATVPEATSTESEDVTLCLIGAVASDKDVMQAAQSFNVPVVTSEDGSEWEHNAFGTIIFVVEDFSGPVYEKLFGLGHRILGPVALRDLVERQTPLPHNTRPLYTLAMYGLVICFTGFHKKDELARLIKLIHNMGGSIRKDMSSSVTHLVANKCTGEKYQYALTFRVPVMAVSWVHNAWAMRPHVGFVASDNQNIVEHKLKTFHGARVCLLGFPEEEQKHMTDVLVENGGTPTDREDPLCTHVVVEFHDDAQGAEGWSKVQKALSKFPNHSSVTTTTTTISANITNTLTIDALNTPTNNTSAVSSQLTSCSMTNTDFCLINNNLNNNKDDSVLKPKRLFIDKNNLDEINSDGFEFDNCTQHGRSICDDLEFKSPSYNHNTCDLDKKTSSQCNDNLSDLEFKSPFSVLSKENPGSYISSTPICTRSRQIIELERDKLLGNINKNLNTSNDFENSFQNNQNQNFFDEVKETVVRRENFLTRCNGNKYLEENFTNSLSLSMMEKLVPRSRMSVCLPNELKLTPNIRLNDNINNDHSLASPKAKKRRQTLSPKKNNKVATTPKKTNLNSKSSNNNGGFKTPIFCALRRSLRLKSVNHLTRWLSTTDIPPNNVDREKLTSSQHCTNSNRDNSPSIIPSGPVGDSCSPEKMVFEEEGCDNLDRPQLHHRMRYNSVIDESTISSLPTQVASSTTYLVKAEWFWASVQNEGCVDEKDYLFEDYLELLLSPNKRTPTSASTTPLSVGRARKRKRIQDVLSRVVASGGTTPAVNKRRSSVSDAGLLSCTPSPSAQLNDESEAVNVIETPRKHMSFRHQVFLELVQTESNYVGILSTIMTLFKEPLEKMCETEDQLLNLTEIKIIFGHLPPIYQTHCQMLEELKKAASHWTEDISIGNIILMFTSELLKAYPPFVNFFENTTEMLVKCDQTKPRFHAFLKKCQTKPECGRQSLQELLIRPVQRLPSICLLLNDILKHTNKSNSDHTALEAALTVIKKVMSHINEDKRRTEGQLAIFDIFNDIDNCPAHLVSSHRSFIARCDLTEISGSLSGRGDPLAFFLFSDILEVCKKRSKAFSNSLKSPNATSGTNKLNNCKPFKHVDLMPLSTIKRVIDIKETNECHKVFALMCKSNQELKEKLYSFMITDEDVDKMAFLKTLCRQMANTVCRADAENFLASLDPEQLDIDTSDLGLGTLGKAFKFATRTKIKVGRAFSFNKTPAKLKRAVSTMMSPFGSSSNLTPASQLAQMRLASCNNLNELTSGSGVNSPALPPPTPYAVPMSVQPQRRSKHSTLSVASLRRL